MSTRGKRSRATHRESVHNNADEDQFGDHLWLLPVSITSLQEKEAT